jgi:integrase
MPTPVTYIPQPSRHKATGQAVVRLNGKDHYLGRHGSPQARAAYEQLIARWLANGRTLPDEAAGRSVNEVLLAFVRHAEGHYQRTGRRCSELAGVKDAARVVRAVAGREPAGSFGPKILKAVRQRMVERGWSRNYVNKMVNRVKRIFRWAASEELIPPSVYHGVQSVPALRRGLKGVRESKPVRPVPRHLLDATLPYLQAVPRAMAELQLLTGARPGEVCALRPCDLDTTGRVWVYRPESHKTAHHGHRREIYLGPRAQAVLKPWLASGLTEYVFSPARSEAIRNGERRRTRKTPMTPSQARRKPKPSPKRPRRDRYSVDSYRQAVRHACRKADHRTRQAAENDLAKKECREPVKVPALVPATDRLVGDWHPNQLRHNAATALRKEYGIELARIILGHSTAFTTEIYAERDRQTALDVVLKVG